ncbi:TPA: 8-oxo-dGTP diphosphatase [Streptococcus suis]|nr:8-oxo-dGTP diphosphatase [Streptococcus suis]
MLPLAGHCFPWWHIELNESLVASVIREVKEETGLTVSNLELCGIQNWTDPTDNYRYLVFCYKTSHFTGSIQSSDEGEVFWIEREDLKNVQLADGFETMLGIFEQPQLTENFYWFEDGEWKVENR